MGNPLPANSFWTLTPPGATRTWARIGIFSYIFPDDEELAEGLREDDWILENVDWLTELFIAHDIPVDEAHMRWFYQAINPRDWRCGSCGGCI